MINHIFSTAVLRRPSALQPAQLGALREYLMALCDGAPGSERSNRGGWRSTGNLFSSQFRQFDFLREAVTAGLLAYIGDVFDYSGQVVLTLTGWTVINRPDGDFNVPHNHAANLLSGVLYVSIPEAMRGGELVFQDPRHNLNAHTVEGSPARAPWLNTTVSANPVEGELIIFPSWLMHYVMPYQCDDPSALRIAISFNATFHS